MRTEALDPLLQFIYRLEVPPFNNIFPGKKKKKAKYSYMKIKQKVSLLPIAPTPNADKHPPPKDPGLC